MTEFQRYIYSELKTLREECRQRGITPIEWVERYAESYHRKYANGSIVKGGMTKGR